MIVSKFGGSSLADSAQIRKVKAIVERDERRSVIVVSAPGKRNDEDIKITDMLYTCQREAASGADFSDHFKAIRERYLGIVSDLELPSDHIIRELSAIEKAIEEGETPDYAASRGEYLCAQIMADLLGWEFLDMEGSIIITDEGNIDPSTYARVAARLEEGRRYVVPGFYGSSTDGKLKTFTRGGSDITGAILSRAAKAEWYENWTDVSGILMADPRLVENPKPIAELTYEEIRELASVGAAVFHEEAIAPVRDAAIPIHIKNTNRPDDHGTFITTNRKDSQQPIIGVSGKTGYTRLFVRKMFLNKDPDYIIKINTILKIHGVIPEFSSIGFDSISYFFNLDNLQLKETMLTRILSELSPDEISSDARIAMIGVVGEGLYDTRGIFAKISAAVSQAGISARYVNYGGSLITCVIGVDENDYRKALKAIYAAISTD